MKAMKIWLLLAVMVMTIAVHARKNDDPEMRHVRLTMTDGTQVEGYIPKKHMSWFLEYQVKLSDNPDGKKAKKYDAENLTKMEWLTPTEEHPEGMVWEHCQAMSRSTIKSVMQDRLLDFFTVVKMHLFIRLTFFCQATASIQARLGLPGMS